MTNPLASDEYLLIGTGERFANADGGNRQTELGRCRPGEQILLRREPANPRDPMAVALYSCRGMQVGYLGREDARWLAPLIDAELPVTVTVERVAPKGRPFSPLALTMKGAARERLALLIDGYGGLPATCPGPER